MRKGDKLKIKKQIQETKEIYVDIELPYYSKSGCFYYKVISKELMLQVCTIDFCLGIDKRDCIDSAIIPGVYPITKKDFNQTYDEVLAKLNKLKETLTKEGV